MAEPQKSHDGGDEYKKCELKSLEESKKIFEQTNNPPDEKHLSEIRDVLKRYADESVIKNFEKALEDVVESVKTMLLNFPGIGDKKDQAVGTNHCVFGILGPNNHNYGNTDCVIIFKEDVMHHVDYFETLCAATFYTNARYRLTKESPHTKNISFDRSAWMGPDTHGWPGIDSKYDPPEREPSESGSSESPKLIPASNEKGAQNIAKETYYKEKYNRSDPAWEEAMALEFILRTMIALERSKTPVHKKIMDITLEDIKDMWLKNNSHAVVEAHLPSSISLDHIERIIMKKDVFEALKSDPDTASVLEKLIKDKGEDFVEKIKIGSCDKCGCERENGCEECNRVYHDMAVNAEFDFFDRRMVVLKRPQICGYSFGIRSDDHIERECFIPAGKEIGESDHFSRVRITFTALGGGFSVRVRNTGDYNCKGVCVDYYTIKIDEKNMGLSIWSKEIKKVTQEPNFNEFCRKDDWIYYCIVVDYAESKITISHTGPSAILEDKGCEISCLSDDGNAHKDIHMFTYASVSAVNNVFIRDFQMNFEEKRW